MEPIVTLSPEHYLYKAELCVFELAPLVEPVDEKQKQIDEQHKLIYVLQEKVSLFDEQQKQIEDMKTTIAQQQTQITTLLSQLQALTTLSEDRFNKVASLLQTVLPVS